MKNRNLLLSLCGAFLLTTSIASAQEYRRIPLLGSAFQDINDSGFGIALGLTYDWDQNKTFPREAGVYRYNSVNNNGDMSGAIVSGPNKVPGFKLKGSTAWSLIPFPTNTTPSTLWTDSVTGQISENGRYIVGNFGVFDQITQKDAVVPFIYDISTNTTKRISNSDFVDGNMYTVNDSGNTAGWVDIPLPNGTRRVPILFSDSGVFKYISDTQGNLPTVPTNDVKAINKNGVAVGQFNNLPFIYDPASDTFTQFANPKPGTYIGGGFASISDDGTIVGMWYNIGQKNRYATIYHPSLGTEPQDLKTLLESRGATVNSTGTLNNMGPAIAISPNGKFIAGFEDGPAAVANGWVVSLPQLVLANNEVNVGVNNVSVYPNPVIDVVNIDLKASKSGTAKVEMYSMEGKLIKSENKNLSSGSNSFKVDVAQVAKATKSMIMVITTPEGTRITKKLVVK